MPESPPRIIGLAWYRREEYPSVLAMMEDRHSLAPTYDQWLMAAENNEQVAQQVGLQVKRVMVRPEEFARWCAEQGMAPGSAARSRYAQEAAGA